MQRPDDITVGVPIALGNLYPLRAGESARDAVNRYSVAEAAFRQLNGGSVLAAHLAAPLTPQGPDEVPPMRSSVCLAAGSAVCATKL